MMLFWLAAAVLTVLIVLALLRPLLKPHTGLDDTAARRLAIYRDQLAQLARDRDAGLVSAEDAAAMEVELQRHMLALPEEPPPPAAAPRGLRVLVLGLMVGLPAAALGLYVHWGMPDVETRLAAAEAEMRARAPLSIDDMVARLEARLRQSPQDATGWQMLGRSMRVLGRPEEAVAALEKARALAPDDGDILGELAEALVQAANGRVTPEAARLFQDLSALDPAEARPPYYLALAMAQAGNAQGAIALWRGLVAASPPDAPWLAATQARIAETAAAAGLDPSAIAPATLAGGAEDRP